MLNTTSSINDNVEVVQSINSAEVVLEDDWVKGMSIMEVAATPTKVVVCLAVVEVLAIDVMAIVDEVNSDVVIIVVCLAVVELTAIVVVEPLQEPSTIIWMEIKADVCPRRPSEAVILI